MKRLNKQTEKSIFELSKQLNHKSENADILKEQTWKQLEAE